MSVSAFICFPQKLTPCIRDTPRGLFHSFRNERCIDLCIDPADPTQWLRVPKAVEALGRGEERHIVQLTLLGQVEDLFEGSGPRVLLLSAPT